MYINPFFLELSRKAYFSNENHKEWMGYLSNGVKNPYCMNVLDLCGGSGYISRWLSSFFSEINFFVLDINKEMIQHGAALRNKKCSFIRADARNLPFSEPCFDVVFIHGAYHLFENVDVLAEQVYRVCIQKAVFFCADMNFCSPYNYFLHNKPTVGKPAQLNNWQELPFVMRNAGFKNILLTGKMVKVDYSVLNQEDYTAIRRHERDFIKQASESNSECGMKTHSLLANHDKLLRVCDSEDVKGQNAYIWDGGPLLIYECFK